MTDRLRLRDITDNLTYTSTEVTAWFVAAPQQWSFRSDTANTGLINHFGRALARLAGHHVHLRVTSRPYPAEVWARNLDADTPNPIGGKDPDSGWYDHLEAVQQRLQSSTLTDKEVYIGVRVGTRHSLDKWIGKAARKPSDREQRRLDGDVNRATAVLSGAGIDATPATMQQVEWLLHRSVALGLPAPARLSAANHDGWTADDLYAFTDPVRVERSRFARLSKIVGDHNGRPVTRYVAVMTMGRMDQIVIPEGGIDPWMQHTDRFAFPVEWSSRVDVLSGQDAKGFANKKLLRIRDMIRSYKIHHMDVPPDMDRKADHAIRIEDELAEGDELVSTRVIGWHRLAVAAATEDDCRDRIRVVQDSFRNMQMDIVHPSGQAALLAEFIPGEPLVDTRYKRVMPVRYMAAALPHVTATVGDNIGPYMGYTCGTSKRAVMVDPWYGPEIAEKSGLVPVVGSLGSGKSALLGQFAHESALRGVTTTILDPSGPLAKLCDLSDLSGHAHHIDLLRSPPGTLNPYSVIPEPTPEQYPDEKALAEAKVIADADRKTLAIDIVNMLLPSRLRNEKETARVLTKAVRDLGGYWNNNLRMLMQRLRSYDDQPQGKEVAEYLDDIAVMPQANLFFGSAVTIPNIRNLPVLLVLTMDGLDLPNPKTASDDWTMRERLAVPLLHLATHYTTRRIYSRPMHERKFVGLDEVGQMGNWESGRNLFSRLGRDSRKWNIAALVSSQNPSDVLGLDIANFISAAFVGRIEDHETAEQALRLIRVETGVGYEKILGDLSPKAASGRRGSREFVYRDVHGYVEKVAIDIGHKPELLAALDTTPARPTVTDLARHLEPAVAVAT